MRDMRRDQGAFSSDNRSTCDILENHIPDRRHRGPSERILLEETKHRVKQALDRLPSHYRDVMVLKYFEDLSFAEIASRLEISDGAAKLRHFRAIASLAGLLGAD
jgi:RNA polymerase sigma factor (sigma-70 family)